jgi:2'-5' RNA ligase
LERLRLFVAMPVPGHVRGKLDEQLDAYRARHPVVRWLDPGSWHLTLLFLGSVATHRLDDAMAMIDGVAAEWSPFGVTIGRGGGHRSRRGSAAWLGVEAGAGGVIALADALLAACPDDLTLGATPRRTPSAHMTVARRVDEELIASLRAAAYGLIGATWRADRVALFRSHLTSSGSTYEMLHVAPLDDAPRWPGAVEEGERWP